MADPILENIDKRRRVSQEEFLRVQKEKNKKKISTKEKLQKGPILQKYLGFKFYKEKSNGEFEIIRLKTANTDGIHATVILEDGKEKIMDIDTLKKYTPLEPYGLASFSIVKVADGEGGYINDVMVMIYRNNDIKFLDDNTPFAICRQSVNDIFAQYIAKDPENCRMVGICINRNDCPANIDYRLYGACDELVRCDIISIYRDDNIESMLKCINTSPFDSLLSKMYNEHIDHDPSKPAARFGNTDNGWCRSLKYLLLTNDFMTDFNLMCDITQFDFDLSNYLIDSTDNRPQQLNRVCTLFFQEVFKIKVQETRVIKYDYSVDLAKFNNTNYVLVRDINNQIWIILYLSDGEYLESELEEEINKLSVTDRLRLSYYDKYKDI